MSKVLGKVVAKVKGPKNVKDAMKDAIRQKYIVVNPKKNATVEALSDKGLKDVKTTIKKKFALLVPDNKGGNMVPKFFAKPEKKKEEKK